MAWLLVLLAALVCWLGYTIYLAVSLTRKGKTAVEGVVCVFMGSQAEVAEWFLWRVYGCEGIFTGRLAVAVAAECPDDDTALIVGVMSRKKGFSLINPEEWRRMGQDKALNPRVLDVRGMCMGELAISCKMLAC